MRVVIVCISDTFFDRVRMLRKYYQSKGNEVIVVTSDFSHRQKQKIDTLNGADIFIETPYYNKNLSARRLYSHNRFAVRAKQEVEKLHPDIIHTIVPANSLCKTMAEYKTSHPEVRLYFDINDLWPEALPIRHFQWIPVLTAWKKLRDNYLSVADRVFVECELFLEGLDVTDRFEVLHFARSQKPEPIHESLDEDKINLVYLGSINNIIDIDLICKIVSSLQSYKPTAIHIIGEGENKDRLISQLQKTGTDIIDHGTVFDMAEKQKVFDQCHYGLNIMKPDVMVGLTMKSLDYMIGGVPMINNIGGDTWKLCEQYNLGWNVDKNSVDYLAEDIANESLEEQLVRRKNMQDAYQKFFTEEIFFKTLEKADA